MFGHFLDLLFPKRSLVGSEGQWLTESERQSIVLTPLLLRKEELQKRGIHHLDSVIAAGSYDDSPLLKKAILTFKYKRIPALHAAIAGWMTSALHQHKTIDGVFVPVPLHWSRRFDRGFNQAELLASSIATLTHGTMLPLLKRTRATGHQAWRPRAERLTALKDAFAFSGKAPPPLHAILVDDLCTTGATLDESAKALRQAGVASVSAIVAAYG
jgi:ComF family protein